MTLNGAPIRVRACPALANAYLLATDPLLPRKRLPPKGPGDSLRAAYASYQHELSERATAERFGL